MKRSRFSEEPIIGILKEQEAGMSTVEVRRRHGISPATFYKWKSKLGGMEVSEAKRLRALEDEMCVSATTNHAEEQTQENPASQPGCLKLRSGTKHLRLDGFITVQPLVGTL